MVRCLLGAQLSGSAREDDLALAESLVLFASGRLALAVKMAAESGYLANRQEDRRREASARLFGALFSVYLGEFSKADRELAAVVQLLGVGPVVDGSDIPIVHALLGALQVFRGDETLAERCFDRGIRAATAASDVYREAIVRAARSDLLAQRDYHRAEDDARFAREVFGRFGDPWFELWARRGLAKAFEYGAVDLGVHVLQDLCGEVSNPLERARTELALGNALLSAGRRDEAIGVLRRATRRFKWHHAPFFQAQALAVLRAADRANSERHGDQLKALAEGRDDPAWDVVLMPPHRLTVSLLGTTPGAVLDGRRLELRPGSLGLLAAIITGEPTSRGALRELFWPEAFRTPEGKERTKRRLRGALHELRSGLGVAGCRLSSGDDPVEFDVRAVEVDYLVGLALEAEARAADRRGDIDGRRRAALDALAILDDPFLATLACTWDWVAEKDDYLREVVVPRLGKWSQ